MGRSYSVLLLRDDQQVRRFQFNPLWLRLFLYLFLVFAALAAGGIYLSYGYWKENQQLVSEMQTLRHQLQEKKVKLASLQNMEKILAVHDPDELQTLLSSARADDHSLNQSPVVDLQEMFEHVASDVASVKDVVLQERDNGTFFLEFTLTNDLEGRKTLTGYVEAACITRDGRFVELHLPEEEMSFHIQRFRSFEAPFSLPQGLVAHDIYALRLVVIAEDGQKVFAKAYPFQQLMGA